MAETPKIHIDSDWKAQAQAEKQKLADQAKAAPKAGAAGAGAGTAGAQPTGFEGLVSLLVSQSLYAMGGVPDPRTGQRVMHLEMARHFIDMLAALEEKTKNNLSEDEATMLAGAIYELRSRYIQASSTPAGRKGGDEFKV